MSKLTKLKIGVFSQMMQVTVKTLRHYEQKGLLYPCEVDEWTGYRYYSVEQMQRLNNIRQLQSLGFSLDEIKDLYEDGAYTPSVEQLNEKIEKTERQLQLLLTRRNHLVNCVNAHKKIQTMDKSKFSIQSLPEIIVASHREVISDYAALGPLCVEKIGPGYCFTIEHNIEYRPTDIDIEYCEQVEEMGTDSTIIQFKRFTAVPKALCMKHVGPYERFHESFTEAFAYMEEQGYIIAGPLRTSYIDGAWNQDNPEQWLSIIQIPVE